MVLAYLTWTRTPLFFRQAVGRIVRTMGTPEDMEAYCFIPDHPTLVRHAQQITEAQAQAIEDETDEEFDRSIRRSLQPSLFSSDDVLGTEHTGTAGTIIEGQALTPEIAAAVAAVARELQCSETVALRVLKKYGVQSTAAPSSGAIRSPQRPLEDQIDDARGAVHSKVKRVAFQLLPDDPNRFKRVNKYVAKFIGKWDRRQFSLDDCRRAVAQLDRVTVDEL